MKKPKPTPYPTAAHARHRRWRRRLDLIDRVVGGVGLVLIAVALWLIVAERGDRAEADRESIEDRAALRLQSRTIACVVAGVLETSRETAEDRGTIDRRVRLIDGRVVTYRELYAAVLTTLPDDCPALLPREQRRREAPPPIVPERRGAGAGPSSEGGAGTSGTSAPPAGGRSWARTGPGAAPPVPPGDTPPGAPDDPTGAVPPGAVVPPTNPAAPGGPSPAPSPLPAPPPSGAADAPDVPGPAPAIILPGLELRLLPGVDPVRVPGATIPLPQFAPEPREAPPEAPGGASTAPE